MFDDADLDKAVRAAFEGGFSNKGGTYTASSPIYVQQGAYPSFVEALAAGIGKLQFGNGLKRGTHVGSCVSQAQQKRLQGYIGIAGGGGGEEVAFEVKLPEDPECKDGLFVAPVVFKNVKPSMTIAQEEILGPVVTVGSFEDEDEAVRVANDSEYGIVASVFTKDVERVCRRRQAGMVLFNNCTRTSLAYPLVVSWEVDTDLNTILKPLKSGRPSLFSMPSIRGEVPQWRAVGPCLGRCSG